MDTAAAAYCGQFMAVQNPVLPVLPVLPQPRKASASNIIMAKPQPQAQQNVSDGDDSVNKHLPPPPPLSGMAALQAALSSIPFQSMLSNRVVQGMCISHFIYGE